MQNQKPLGTRVLSLALTAAMVATMMPQTVFAEGTAPQVQGDTLTTTRTITAVGELGEGFAKSVPFDGHTYVLDVKAGTPFAEVKLPTELSVTVEKITTTATAPAAETPAVETPVVETPVVETPAVETPAASEPTTPTTEANTTVLNNEPTTPSGAEPAPVEKPAEVVPTAPNQGNTTIIETTQENVPVTWKGDKEYTAAPSSNVVYTPVLPEGYALKDGVVLPIINVMVGKKIMTPMQATSRAVTPVTRTTPLDLTATRLTYIGSDGSTSKTANPTTTSITDTGEGWSWDQSRKTLTLNGANIDCSGCATVATDAFGIKLPASASIELSAGSESIVKSGNSSNESGFTAGIKGDTVVIKGTGKLTVNAGSSKEKIVCDVHGIDAKDVSVYGGELNITCNNETQNTTKNSFAIVATTRLAIYAGKVVATSGKGTSSIAIYANKVLVSNGELNANTSKSPAIRTTSSDMQINGGLVRLKAEENGLCIDSAGGVIFNTKNATVINAKDPVNGNPNTKKVYAKTPADTLVITFNPCITFDSRGGTAYEPIEVESNMTLPADPIWAGYTFDGWYDGIDGTDATGGFEGKLDITKAKALAANTTVYAKWINGAKTVRTGELDIGNATETIDKLSSEGWKWDNTSKTLTLNDIEINSNIKNSFGIRLPNITGENVTVQLEGTKNKIATTNDGGVALVLGGNTTFKGTGSIDISSAHLGINIMNSTLSIDSGNIKVTSAQRAIYANDFIMNGGELTVTAASDSLPAIDAYVDGGKIVINGGAGTVTNLSNKAFSHKPTGKIGKKITNWDTSTVSWTNDMAKPSVSFDARNGTTIADVDIGNSMTLPENPTRAGYDFDGWYDGIDGTDAAGGFEGKLDLAKAKALTDSIDVYAKWTKNGKTVYTQSIDFSTATGNLSGDGYAWNNASKTLTLDGLTIDSRGQFAIRLPANASITASGTNNFTLNNIGVDYKAESGFKAVAVIDGLGDLAIDGTGTININSKYNHLNNQNLFTYGINSDTNLKIDGVTIKIDLLVPLSEGSTEMGSSEGLNATTLLEIGTIAAPKINIKLGTAYVETGIFTDTLKMVSGDVVIESRNGIFTTTESILTGGNLILKGKDEYSDVFEDGLLTADGATILGSKTDITGANAVATSVSDILNVDNTYLYLDFSFTKAVNFDARNGVASDKAEIGANGKITMPTPPTWTGYDFGGWYTGIDGTGDEVTADKVYNASTTVYAKWTKGGKMVRTTPLDLTTTSNIDNLATEGWKWDAGTSTLTLDGANIDCSGNAATAGGKFGIQLLTNHKIVLANGSINTVKAGDTNEARSKSNGINFTSGESGDVPVPSISGKGTLYATSGVGGNNSASLGIFCDHIATLTFSDATVYASSTKSNIGMGLAGKLDVKSGTIIATGTGISVGMGINVASLTMSGGTVTATGTGSGDPCVGIMGETLNMTGGTLSASGKTAAISMQNPIIAATATVTGENETFASGTTTSLTQSGAEPVVISFTKAVNFDSRGGSAVQSAEIAENGTITMPAKPTWGDYTFGGWYTDVDGKGTAFVNSNLTASTTVYAKWTKGGKAVLTEPLDLSTATENLSGDGWKWDHATKTLTLSGITLNSAKNDANNEAIGILFPNAQCTIILEDGTENTVDVSTAKNSKQSQAIYCDSKLIIKTSGKGTPGKLNAIAANADNSSIGICSGGGIVIESGNITTTAGDSANSSSMGISTGGGDIHIKGGTVNATGGKSDGSGSMTGSYGMFGTNVQIDDGTVTATGGAASAGLKFSAGIIGRINVKLNGGNINAKGNTAAVAALAGTLEIDDIANVKVNDKLAKVASLEISSKNPITTFADDKDAIIKDAAIKFKPTYKGENPLAPNAAKATRTHDTITLETKTIAGEIVEYGIYKNGKIEWQPTPIFSGLTANTEYIFCIRVKANDTHKAGATSAETTIKTKTAPVSVSGVVKDSDDNLLENVKVELKQGGKLFMDAVTTGADGKYSFVNVPEGVYSLVLTNGTVIITESVTVKGTVIDHKDMKFLKGNKNTEVQSDTETEVAVSGMNDLLTGENFKKTLTPEQKNAVDAGGSVDLKLTANLKESADVGEDKGAIEAKAGEQEIALLLDLSVFRTVTDKAGKPVTDGTSDNRITELAGIITVHLAIPEHLQGKDGLSLYRMHKGVAEKLNKGVFDGSKECYTIDPSGTFMTLYLNKFSTYAMGCNTFDVTITGASGTGKYRNGDTVTINAGSKSGYTFDSWTVDAGSVTLANANSAITTFVMPTEAVKLTANWTYTGGGTGGNPGGNPAPQVYYYINATTSRGGSINTPERVKVIAGGSASFTITPDKGYQIADVLVNGNSIGAKNSYVFTNVNADQTIHATFKKAGHRNPQTGVDANEG